MVITLVPPIFIIIIIVILQDEIMKQNKSLDHGQYTSIKVQKRSNKWNTRWQNIKENENTCFCYLLDSKYQLHRDQGAIYILGGDLCSFFGWILYGLSYRFYYTK